MFIAVVIIEEWISRCGTKVAYPVDRKNYRQGTSALFDSNKVPTSDGSWKWYYIRRFWLDGCWTTSGSFFVFFL
jgi:hypothetical protein